MGNATIQITIPWRMIIAVGFKVNSERAVQFRKWVNQIAKRTTPSKTGSWMMNA